MAKLNRTRIVSSIENKIVTGLITSDSFCRQLAPILKKDYFAVEYAGIIAEWCRKFFHEYHKSPKQHIEDIYLSKREEVGEDMADIIHVFLKTISDQYEQDGLNVDYLLNHSFEYLRKRSLEVTHEQLSSLLDKGKVDKAERLLQEYRRTARSVSSWVNPLDPEYIKNVLLDEEEDHIFRFPGKLGDISGWHERGWFVAVVAPMKRGKSFFLQEVAVQCILNRKKVAFFSLEMQHKRVSRRILARLTAYGKREGTYVYPCFDCLSNQDGTCKKESRINRKRLVTEEGAKPQFSLDMKYRPCTACRGTGDFKLGTWFTTRKREKMELKKTIRKVKAINIMFGDNFRMRSFPANSANMQDIKAELDALEYMEDFIPDVIIIDYADILKPEDARQTDERHRANETWKMMKNMSDERNVLLFTATQGNRKSIDKKSMVATDISEDIRKFAHIDMMYAISQTTQEKREGVMRISIIGLRDEDFDEDAQILVLQQRALGQILLDSELATRRTVDKELDIMSGTL